MTTSAESPARTLSRVAAEITHAGYAQRDAEPDHGDFYPIYRAIEEVLDALYALNANVGGQVAHYGDGRRLRTDTDRGPDEVLASAVRHGTDLHNVLRTAKTAAHQTANECARLAVHPDELPEQ